MSSLQQGRIMVMGILFLLSLAEGTVSAAGQEPLDARVEFSAATDRRTYFVGEPVWLALALSNKTEQDISGDFYMECGWGMDGCPLEIHYRLRGEKTFQRFGSVAQKFRGIESLFPPGRLRARATLTGKALLLYDSRNKRFVLEKAGTYDFKAIHFDPSRDRLFTESAVVSIDVLPVPEQEREAWKAYAVPAIGEMMQDPLLPPAEAIGRVAVLVENYPRSRYAIHVLPTVFQVLEARVKTGAATELEKAFRARLKEREARGNHGP